MIWALLWLGCAKHAPTPVVSMEALRAGCAQGDVSACIDALLVYRDGEAREARLEEDLLESACSAGFAWSCLELGRRAHASAEPGAADRARGAWSRACEAAPNLYNCGLAQGKWPADPPPDPALPPAFSAALAASGARFRMPARFTPAPPVRCGGLEAQWGMVDDRGMVEVQYLIWPGVGPEEARARYDRLLPSLTADPAKLTAPQPFPDPAFRVEFGADGAWMNAFPPDPACTGAPLGATILAAREAGGTQGERAAGPAGAMVVLVWLHQLQGQQVWPAAFHALQFTAPGWPW